MKYKSLAELKAAYESGELSRSNSLMIDNDHCFVYVGDEQVFYSGGPDHLIDEALALLGIPCEGV